MEVLRWFSGNAGTQQEFERWGESDAFALKVNLRSSEAADSNEPRVFCGSVAWWRWLGLKSDLRRMGGARGD
jgi:hypothetical protein